MIRRLLIFVLFFVSSLWGQFVNITGNVTDPVSGQPYQNATGRATLISGNGQTSAWTIGGVNPVRTPVIVNLDSFGNFTTSLTNTCLIDQQTAQPVWQFSWTSAEYANVGTVSFTGPALALCNDQSITQQITNVPPAPLPVSGGGGGGGGGGVGGSFIISFTAATTVSILGITHRLGTRGIDVTCFDNASPANYFEPGSYTIDNTTFNVLINFALPKTGYCALMSGGSGSGGGGGGGGGTGTVTSVGLVAPPSVFTVTGSPITSSGNLTIGFTLQNPNVFLAGPVSGAGTPAFRLMTIADFQSFTTGNAPKLVTSSGFTAPAGSPVCDDGSGNLKDTGCLGNGAVTSVGLTATPSNILTVTGSPITTSGTFGLTMKTTGNANQVATSAVLAGPAGTGLCEDGNGNIRDTACQGTFYAQKYCNTMGSLDDSCITNALAALPANGGIIYLGYGTYNMANTVTINKPVILQGVGASTNCTQANCQIEPPFTPGTLLSWTGGANTNMIFITPSGSNGAIGGVNLRNISFDTNSVSSVTAIDINCLEMSSWDSVNISHANIGMVLGCRTGANTMLNTFTQIDMNLVNTGMVMDGPADGPCSPSCGDAFNNTFTRLHIDFNGTAGIDIKSADNNTFLDLTIYRNSGTGTGIWFEAASGSGVTNRLGGLDNYIYHYQPPTTNGATFNSGGNAIHDWDISNGQATPKWSGSPNNNFVSITGGGGTDFFVSGGSVNNGGLYLEDADPSDTAPGKGMVVNGGKLNWMSSNQANVMMTLDDFANLTVNGHLSIGQGITPNAGFQSEHSASFEGSITGTAFGSFVQNTFTWPVAFVDNNYSAVCSAYIAQGFPGLGGITHTPTTITITTINLSNSGFASQGAWHCIAVHD